MSVDLLRHRLTEDIAKEARDATEILVARRQATLDEMRYQQGVIAGLEIAQGLLDERFRNLHAMG